MKKLSLALLAVVGLFFAIIIVRTATFKSRQLRVAPAAPMSFDQDAIVRRLAEAITLRTVSFQSRTESSAAAFQRFHDLLANFFPRAYAQLAKETVNDYSLLFTWKGKNEQLKPILLMAHMDVVPVDDRIRLLKPGQASGELHALHRAA